LSLVLDLPVISVPDTTLDLEQLYRRAWGVARRLGPKIWDPSYDLEDMVQVAVTGAWRALSSVPVQSPEHAWHLGYQAMRKAVWSEFRRLYRTPDRTFDLVDIAAMPSEDQDPLAKLVEQVSVGEIRVFIESLSPVEQDALARSVLAYSHGRRGAVRVVLSKSVDNALQRVRKKAEVRFGRRGVQRRDLAEVVLRVMERHAETAPGGPGAGREDIRRWAAIEKPQTASEVLSRLVAATQIEVCGKRRGGRIYRLLAGANEVGSA